MSVCNWHVTVFILRLAVVLFLPSKSSGGGEFAERADATPARVTNENIKNGQNFLIVSTIDGHISAFDCDDGRIIWSIVTEPGELLSSSLSKLEASDRGEKVRLVPSLDGNLFKFDGKKLEPLPVSAELLLRNSYKFGDNLLIIGGKEVTGYGVNADTGELRYTCSAGGCNQLSHVSPEETVLVVERHTQTVRAINSRNGNDQWNFRVSEHHISLSEGSVESLPDYETLGVKNPHLLITSVDRESSVFSPYVIKVDMVKGFLGMMDHETKQFRWSQKLSSPIVDVWQVKHGKVESFDLFHDGKESAFVDDRVSSLLLVGVYDEMLYVKKSDRKYDDKHLTGRVIPFYPLIPEGAKAFASDGNVRETSGINQKALILKESSYLYGEGMFFYAENEDILNTSHCPAGRKSRLKSLKERTFTLFYHWMEIVLISGILTLLVNVMICLLYRRIKPSIQASSSLSSSLSQDHCDEHLESVPVVHDQHSSDEYVSRYLTDFEPVTCLGRGGYGVVFEAKNKIDECSYAVKRIKLSTRDGANDKIMREVKALAKLDHSGIVRYFNSWVENPPPNWQEAKDKEFENLMVSYIPESLGPISEDSTSSQPHLHLMNPLKPYDDELLDYPRQRLSFTSEFRSESAEHSSIFEDMSMASNTFTDKRTESGCRRMKKTGSNMINKQRTCDMYLYIQMQLCQKKSLKDWLLSNDHARNKAEVLSIFHQIVCAVEYVHKSGLIHRDLKPSNIFFSVDGVVKIGDFGLVAPVLCDGVDADNSHLPQGGKKNSVKHSDFVGTHLYMSPEQMQGLAYDQKVDIFSLGMIFYELLMPFSTQSERIKVLTQVKKRKFPRNFRDMYKDECELASKLLSPNPSERPSASEIKEHPLLQEFEQGCSFGQKSDVPCSMSLSVKI